MHIMGEKRLGGLFGQPEPHRFFISLAEHRRRRELAQGRRFGGYPRKAIVFDEKMAVTGKNKWDV